MGHQEIASVAEPWLLLPFCYAARQEGVISEYGHYVSAQAFEDFIANLPEGEADYDRMLREFAMALYARQCRHNETYFLDKTPRYYLIIEEIGRMFPEAKFIFLFRNPVHIMGSVIETWGKGSLRKLYASDRDLHFGPEALSRGCSLLKDRAYALRFEDFVQDPQRYIRELCSYLQIPYDSAMLDSFSQQDTGGRMGDPTGVRDYSRIETQPLDKWKTTFGTAYRRTILRQYLERLDDSALTLQGYDKETILGEVNALKVVHRGGLRDRIDMLYSHMVRVVKPNIWFAPQTKAWSRNRFLY